MQVVGLVNEQLDLGRMDPLKKNSVKKLGKNAPVRRWSLQRWAGGAGRPTCPCRVGRRGRCWTTSEASAKAAAAAAASAAAVSASARRIRRRRWRRRSRAAWPTSATGSGRTLQSSSAPTRASAASWRLRRQNRIVNCFFLGETPKLCFFFMPIIPPGCATVAAWKADGGAVGEIRQFEQNEHKKNSVKPGNNAS